MQFFAAVPHSRDQISVFQDVEMLADSLARHATSLAKFTESLPVIGMQSIEKPSTALIGKRLEDLIHCTAQNMQPFSCMSNVGQKSHEIGDRGQVP